MKAALPPGPKSAILGLDFAQEFRKDPLNKVLELKRTYGDFIYMKLGPINYFILNHPDQVKEVLVTRAKEFGKSEQFKRIIRSVDGNGLVASEGDFWLKQRRTIQPTFAHDKLAKYADVIGEEIDRHVEAWKEGDIIDVAEAMTNLTLTVAAKIFLGVDVRGREKQLADAVTGVSQSMYREFTEVIPIPDWFPIPSKADKRRAIATLDKLIDEGVEAQSRVPIQGSMVSMLLQARDTEGGGSLMTRDQVVAEAKTMFNAGHDSTAAALSWAWYLLAKNDREYDILLAEADPGRYALQVAKETLRLYPPAWVLARQSQEDTEIGGFSLPKGATVNVFPFIIQRDPRFFEEPELFKPDRFSPESEHKHLPFSWFPFGAGQRSCIGREFALMEMQLILVQISRKFRFELLHPQNEVEMNPLISLEPKGPIAVRVHVRR